MSSDSAAPSAQDGPTADEAQKPAAAVPGRLKTAASLLGRTLKGQYRIEKELGQGAYGVVFRATQLSLEKPVAVKMLRPDGFHTSDSLDRFSRESSVVSKLVHPSIAQVLDYGVDDDVPFLVMEFVDGRELTDVLKTEGPMLPARALAVMRQLASALHEAHQHGIVHRDIKPHNLRLMRYEAGGQIFLKVLDFGIAKQMDESAGHKLTATGAVMGTPAYMAPEQASGQGVDARADQYAAGIVLYELLTGEVPFLSQTVSGILMAHLTKPPPPLPRGVPEPLRRVVTRLLDKDPANRYATCAEMDRALADCESSCRDVPALSRRAGQSTETGVRPVQGRTARSATMTISLAAGMGLLLVAGVVAMSKLLHPGPKPADQTAGRVLGAAGGDVGGTPPQQPIPGAGDVKAKDGVPTPTPPVLPQGPQTPGLTASGTGLKPATLPEKDPADKLPKKQPVAAPSTSGKKPAVPSKTGNPSLLMGEESANTKERLDKAAALMKEKQYADGIAVAKRTLSNPVPRTYYLLVKMACLSGDLELAKTHFHMTPIISRLELLAVCRQNSINPR